MKGWECPKCFFLNNFKNNSFSVLIKNLNTLNNYILPRLVSEKYKKCSTCKKYLSLDDFNKNKSNKDGYNYHCKMCHNKHDKRYRIKYPDKNAERVKEWRRKKLIGNV